MRASFATRTSGSSRLLLRSWVKDGQFIPFLWSAPDRMRRGRAADARGVRTGSFGRETRISVLGHEDLTVETVIRRTDRFVMTEKFGPAGEVHADNDDRGNADDRLREVGDDRLRRSVRTRRSTV